MLTIVFVAPAREDIDLSMRGSRQDAVNFVELLPRCVRCGRLRRRMATREWHLAVCRACRIIGGQRRLTAFIEVRREGAHSGRYDDAVLVELGTPPLAGASRCDRCGSSEYSGRRMAARESRCVSLLLKRHSVRDGG